jgi:hypothetical protein
VELNAAERAAFDASVKHVKELAALADKSLGV